jgi:hypothetical protein
MKNSYFYIGALTIMFILNLIVINGSVRNKRIINDCKKYVEISEAANYNSLMRKTMGLQIEGTTVDLNHLKRIDFNSIDPKEQESVNGSLIIYLSNKICTPCVERFFEAFFISLKEEVKDIDICIIAEVLHPADIILFKQRYNIEQPLYFLEHNLLESMTYHADKPISVCSGSTFYYTESVSV